MDSCPQSFFGALIFPQTVQPADTTQGAILIDFIDVTMPVPRARVLFHQGQYIFQVCRFEDVIRIQSQDEISAGLRKKPIIVPTNSLIDGMAVIPELWEALL
jgi:hypothetical protein